MNEDDRKRREPPLFVDLDGSLVANDTLDESLAGLLTSQPHLLLMLPWWFLRGRAHGKRRLAGLYSPDPAQLKYHPEILAFLREEKAKGREIVLATAADETVARRVAAHTGLFDAVLASDGQTNLAGEKKLTAIINHAQGRKFAYLGNSGVDLPIWRAAGQVLVATRGPALLGRLAAAGLRPQRVFSWPRPRLAALIRLLRPHQWAKNLLLFVSLALAHLLGDPLLLFAVFRAFAAFCLCASAAYIANDLCDLEADRQHPVKRHRPLAAGLVSLRQAALAAGILLAGGLAVALSVNQELALLVSGYLVATLGYSLWIKRLVLLDVVTLSLLYTARIVAGSAAIGIKTTPWLMGFSIFIFLSLALAKRYSELRRLQLESGPGRAAGRGYSTDDLEQLAIFGGASGYLSVLVLALYMHSPEVARLYGHIRFMWLICPLLIYWISRLWLLARRGILDEDPVVFTLRDRASYLVGAAIVGLLLLSL